MTKLDTVYFYFIIGMLSIAQGITMIESGSTVSGWWWAAGGIINVFTGSLKLYTWYVARR